MRNSCSLQRWIFGLVVLTASFGPAVGWASRAGFAERDITPEIGAEQPGGYHKSFHRSIHDPCKVRAAVFENGDQRVAIVGVDALAIPRQLVVACRETIVQRCELAPESIMIAASHSHSSGPTGMVQPGEYDHASELVQRLAYEDSSAADPDYLNRVQQAIVEAVCAACDGLSEVQSGFGVGQESEAAYNRRFRMRNGLTHTHPGQGNPDIVESAGPIDPDVGVIAVWDQNDTLLGCVVNFACHATTSPGGISANYIYYIEQVIRGVMGQQAIVVFTAGATGDVTQVNNLSPYRHPKPEQWAKLVGGRVGAEALKVMFSMERTNEFSIAACSKILQIKRRSPSEAHLNAARQIVEQPRDQVDRTAYTFAKETLMLAAKLEAVPVASVEVQAIQVGPAVFASSPAEYFCQYGLDIKAGSPFPLTFPVSMANGCVGYVPTEEALGPHGGGYETRLTSYSNLIPTAGTTIANACIDLTKSLTPDQIPTRPPHAPFRGNGWSYGNVAPQLD
jgi:neutral ceramidase